MLELLVKAILYGLLAIAAVIYLVLWVSYPLAMLGLHCGAWVVLTVIGVIIENHSR